MASWQDTFAHGIKSVLEGLSPKQYGNASRGDKKCCAKNHNTGEQREIRLNRFLIGQTN